MIFVTGATGMVGANLIALFERNNVEYKALKRKSSTLNIVKNVFKIHGIKNKIQNIKWVEGDVTDYSSLLQLMENCDKVVHAAGFVSFNKFDKNKLEEINIFGTENVVNASLALKIEKLIYISSIATLGNSNSNLITEDDFYDFGINKSYYAETKYFAEQNVWRASAEGLNVTILNPSVILGVGNWNSGSPKIFSQIYKGLKFYTVGKTGFVDVIDLCKIINTLIFNCKIGQKSRFIINGHNVSYKQIFKLVANNFNVKEPKFKATKFLLELVWRLEAILFFFLRRTPTITKETANSAMSVKSYDNSKIVDLIKFKFIDIDITIKNYCNAYLNSLR